MGAWLTRCRLPSSRQARMGKVSIHGCFGCEYYEPRDMRCCRFYPFIDRLMDFAADEADRYEDSQLACDAIGAIEQLLAEVEALKRGEKND